MTKLWHAPAFCDFRGLARLNETPDSSKRTEDLSMAAISEVRINVVSARSIANLGDSAIKFSPSFGP